MIVVDASVVAVALGDDGADGERARVRLTDGVLAAYVALDEALDVVLVTADARLARAPGIRCEVETIGRPPG